MELLVVDVGQVIIVDSQAMKIRFTIGSAWKCIDPLIDLLKDILDRLLFILISFIEVMIVKWGDVLKVLYSLYVGRCTILFFMCGRGGDF